MSARPGPTSGYAPRAPERETPERRVLSAADVEAVARRVVELLGDASAPSDEHLVWTVAEVAEQLGRSEERVRDHRAELGVLPARGERPRLLFDPDRVRAWATARQEVVRSEPRDAAPALARRRRRGRSSGSAVPLLPIRGHEEAA